MKLLSHRKIRHVRAIARAAAAHNPRVGDAILWPTAPSAPPARARDFVHVTSLIYWFISL